MTDVLERLERLERLMGVGAPERPPAAGDAPAPAAAVSAPPRQEGVGSMGRWGPAPAEAPRVKLGDWVRSKRALERRPDSVVVGVVVSPNESGGGSNSHVLDRGEVPFDLKYLAGVYQALASETRLAMLRELFAGPRTRAELMEAVGLDRGQLYHHLRDLFVQGLVVQPVRGSYKLTGRGMFIFLGAGTAAELGGREGPAIPFDPDEEDEPAALTGATARR